MDTATEAIIIADSDSTIESFNLAAKHIFGYDTEEAVGMPLTALMPERFRDLHCGGMQRYLATGESRVIGNTVELSGLRKDGAEFPLELSTSEILQDEDRLFVGVLRDITERRQAEDALRESESRLRNVTANAPIVIFQTNTEGVFEFVAGRGLESLGVGPEDLLEVSAFEAFAESPDVLDAMQRAYAGEEFTTAVEIQDITFETLYRPLWEKGEVVGLIGVATDITERERAAAALRDERAFLEAVLENTDDGVVACDAQDDLVLFNHAAWMFYGLPEESLAPEGWASRYDLYAGDGETPMPNAASPSFSCWTRTCSWPSI